MRNRETTSKNRERKTKKPWQDPKNPWKTREFCTLSIWSFLWVGRPCLISSNPIVQHPTRGLPCGLCMFCLQVTLNHPSRRLFAWFVPICYTSNDFQRPNILGWLNDLIFIGSFGLDPQNRGLWKYRVYIGTYKFNQIHNFNIARYFHENRHKTSLPKKTLNWVQQSLPTVEVEKSYPQVLRLQEQISQEWTFGQHLGGLIQEEWEPQTI